MTFSLIPEHSTTLETLTLVGAYLRYLGFFTSLSFTIWSYINFAHPVRPEGSDDGLYGLVVIIYWFFLAIFIQDIFTLPSNIYYVWSVLTKRNISDSKWDQVVALGQLVASASLVILV